MTASSQEWRQIILALIAAAALLWLLPAPVEAAQSRFSVEADPLNTTPLPHAAPGADLTATPALALNPDWLAIEDDASGIAVTLADMWLEDAGNPEHERDVTATPGWTFSRIFNCLPERCRLSAKAVVSGGILPARADIRSAADLAAQMSRREVAEVAMAVAGIGGIAESDLQPIARNGAFGYRLAHKRLAEDGGEVGQVVDCLYAGNRFLVVTVINESLGGAGQLVDAIETGVAFKPAGKVAPVLRQSAR